MFKKEPERYKPVERYQGRNAEEPLKKVDVSAPLSKEALSMLGIVGLIQTARSLDVDFNYDYYLRFPSRVTPRQRAYLYACIRNSERN